MTGVGSMGAVETAPLGEPLSGIDELLPEPPAEEVVAAVIEFECPACGAKDPAVEQVEDAEVAKCGQCGCEYCHEGLRQGGTHWMLKNLNEQRRVRFSKLDAMDLQESLPASTSGHAFLFLDQ